MWSAVLNIGGWLVFWVLLLFYVRWAAFERNFFTGQDPEDWRPDFPSEGPSPEGDRPQRMERISRVASLGRPA